MVVYDDFECPYCSRMHQTLIDVLKSYGDRIKVVYKDFPLFEIHPWAERAAIDSGCLAKQSAGRVLGFCRRRARQRTADSRRTAPAGSGRSPRWTGSRGRRANGTRRMRRHWIAASTRKSKTDLKASVKEAEGVGVESTPAIFVRRDEDGRRDSGRRSSSWCWTKS